MGTEKSRYRLPYEIIYGNIILGRFDHLVGRLISGKDVYNDEQKLGEIATQENHWVVEQLRGGIEEFAFLKPHIARFHKAEINRGPCLPVKATDFLEIIADKETIKRYFYDGLPPTLSKIFDEFYKESNGREDRLLGIK